MKQFVGSLLITIGQIWVTVTTCGTIIVGFLLWLGVLIWLATSFWGGVLWAALWVFIGGGLTAALVGILSLPTRLFGGWLVVLGDRLNNPDYEGVDEARLDDCMSCGSERVSDDDRFYRTCGTPYG